MKSSVRLFAVMFIVACRSNPGLETETDAKPITGSSAVSYGDCAEARRRAAARPDLDVDRLPTPVRRRPPAFQRMPASVKGEIDRNGAVVKIDVVIDTLGRPDMTTFTIVKVSNAWFAENLRSTLPSWRFAPAELAGCKVRRVYKFSASAKPRA